MQLPKILGPGGQLQPFELSHNDDADNDQQKPRADLRGMYHPPAPALMGILPGAEKCSDVLREPDEEANEQERESERHLEAFALDSEMHSRPPEAEGNRDNQQPANVPDKVV